MFNDRCVRFAQFKFMLEFTQKSIVIHSKTGINILFFFTLSRIWYFNISYFTLISNVFIFLMQFTFIFFPENITFVFNWVYLYRDLKTALWTTQNARAPPPSFYM